MKFLLRDPLFCGVISLQVATAIFVYGRSWGASFPLPILANYVASARVESGATWPVFAAYDANGVRREIIPSSHLASAVIFKSTCSCDETQVTNWLQAARQKGEAVTLLVPLDEKEEKQAIARNSWKGRILRVRRVELERLGLIVEGKANQLPIMAHLDANGAILGVQRSS